MDQGVQMVNEGSRYRTDCPIIIHEPVNWRQDIRDARLNTQYIFQCSNAMHIPALNIFAKRTAWAGLPELLLEED